MKKLLPILGLLFAANTYATPVAPAATTYPQAAAQPATASAQDNEAKNPVLQLRMTLDSLISFMSSEPQPARPAIARFLDKEIAPLFDFDYMAQMAAGRSYKRFNESQRTAMADLIKRMFLTETTMKLMEYGPRSIYYPEPRIAEDGSQAILRIAVYDPRTYYPTRIDLFLAPTNEGWKVYDIAANGQSAVMYFRRQLLVEARTRFWERER